MTVLDLLNQPWAITPEKLDAMCAVYDRHAAGTKFDAAEIKAAIGFDPTESENDAPYTVQDGVAVIPVEGILAKKMNMFMSFSGGMSTQMLVQAVADAEADPTVHSLIFPIDSPGGEVDGTQQLADAIAACTKPTAAWVDGMACSAAYWVASQCGSIYAASDTTQIGSIGVIIKHTDASKANANRGIAVTHITSGKYKAAGNPDNPLSQQDREYMQEKIDYLATLFIDSVAVGRDMTASAVEANAGEANVYFAAQAQALGLIDGVASMDSVINMLVTANATKLSSTGASASAFQTPGANPMFRTFANQADFDAHNLAEFNRGAASVNTTDAIAAARAEGATSEVTRIKAVQAVGLPGHEALIATLAFDGKTTAGEAAIAVTAAERTALGTRAAALEIDAPKVIPPTQAASAAAEEASAKERRDAATAASGETVAVAAETDPNVIAALATDYRNAQKATGKVISFSDAVAHVSKPATK